MLMRSARLAMIHIVPATIMVNTSVEQNQLQILPPLAETDVQKKTECVQNLGR